MKEAYGLSKQLVVATPNTDHINDCLVGALLITATVAGTAQCVLSGGSTVPIAFAVGTQIFTDLCVVNVSSTTGTATFYQLA
jgi:hypothetical protein